MSRLDDALKIIDALGLPSQQQNERSALTLLALADIGPSDPWSAAKQPLLRTVDIMEFMRAKYGKNYAANTRETIRRQTLHQFEQARVVDRNPDDPARPTNSGKNAYALTDDALKVVRAYGSAGFDKAIKAFVKKAGVLKQLYAGTRQLHQVPLTLPDGSTVLLSPGKHNELQVAVIQELGPRFAPGAQVLYVGDTAKKHVVYEEKELARLKVPITQHDKLPDVILYLPARNWLILIEAVTTHGPVSPKRYRELEEMLARCAAEPVYITAFPDRETFRNYLAEIAWETEVWIADDPDHMIHFNGPKFLGPYSAGKGKP